jgi:hypothetical protein
MIIGTVTLLINSLIALSMLKKSLPSADTAVLEAKINHTTWQPNVSQSQVNNKLIQRIISSNEELIHEQMMKIR